MSDITMCKNWDCPYQDNCWRLLAPPNLTNQAYQDFKFDYEAFETNNPDGSGCDFYIDMDAKFNSNKKELT
mgnify:FL=1|tara:strand:- start:36404 stop:36616 length:213 start_codon:yes stop_codon:yes gene_type:complete